VHALVFDVKIKEHVDFANGIALSPESRMREKRRLTLIHPQTNKLHTTWQTKTGCGTLTSIKINPNISSRNQLRPTNNPTLNHTLTPLQQSNQDLLFLSSSNPLRVHRIYNVA